MSNELATLKTKELATNEVFETLSKNADYVGRVQLYTKGTAINKRLIGPGEYGIPESKDKITVLGDTIDVLPLARRPKAIDISDTDAIITSFDPSTDEFKRIQGDSGKQDSGCMYGISFLVLERSTGRFLEFFCGTKSSRPEAGKIYPFLPTAKEGPKPMTLKSRLVEKKSWSWHVPVALPCSTPFKDVPPVKEVQAHIDRFLNEKGEEVEKVQEPANKRAR